MSEYGHLGIDTHLMLNMRGRSNINQKLKHIYILYIIFINLMFTYTFYHRIGLHD